MNDIRAKLPCPRCSQGNIQEATIKGPGTSVWVCDECEATWFSASAISNDNFIDLGNHLESIGQPPLWSELLIK